MHRVKDSNLLVEAFDVDRIYLRHKNQGLAPDYRVKFIIIIIIIIWKKKEYLHYECFHDDSFFHEISRNHTSQEICIHIEAHSAN
jgi:hypothetical protein